MAAWSRCGYLPHRCLTIKVLASKNKNAFVLGTFLGAVGVHPYLVIFSRLDKAGVVRSRCCLSDLQLYR